jgi:hypothetical protein
MVLVRLRLETPDGEKKYFKTLLPLPTNQTVLEICTSIIGEKIGLPNADWKTYTVYEVAAQDGPPVRKFEPTDNFASLKNGAWLLVKSNLLVGNILFVNLVDLR